MIEQLPNSCVATLSRLYWMMVGPIILGMMAFVIARDGNGWLTAADFGYFGALALTMMARWLEFRGSNPQTADGQPATSGHLRRYLMMLSVIGIASWVLANIVGNYLINRA